MLFELFQMNRTQPDNQPDMADTSSVDETCEHFIDAVCVSTLSFVRPTAQHSRMLLLHQSEYIDRDLHR